MGGSVIDWVMKTRGLSFRHAVELLRNHHPSLAAGRVVRKDTTTKLEASVKADADDQFGRRDQTDGSAVGGGKRRQALSSGDASMLQ